MKLNTIAFLSHMHIHPPLIPAQMSNKFMFNWKSIESKTSKMKFYCEKWVLLKLLEVIP